MHLPLNAQFSSRHPLSLRGQGNKCWTKSFRGASYFFIATYLLPDDEACSKKSCVWHRFSRGWPHLQSWTKVLGHLHFFAENRPSSISPSPSPSPSQCCISGLEVHFFGATLTRGEGGRHFAQTRPSRASKTERLANTCHIFRLSQGLLSRIVVSSHLTVLWLLNRLQGD